MENLSIKIKQTIEIDSEITLPKYFTINKYNHYKLVDPTCVVSVTYYPSSLESIKALEIFSSIRMENIRYVQYIAKPENIDPLTEKEFLTYFNEAKKLILSA
jgi:hypothetical protein